jgi:hypothetical protein
MGVHLKLGDSFAFKAEDTKIRVTKGSQAQWFKPVILAPQEIEIRRIVVQGQSGQKFARLHLSGKTWYASAHSSSQSLWEAEEEDHSPVWLACAQARPYLQSSPRKKG